MISTHGFEPSKNYIELKCKKGLISREKANEMIKKLKHNYKTGVARREMEASEIKDYWRY